MEIFFIVGRILLGGFFIMNGISHFKDFDSLRGYAVSKNVANPGLVVAVGGLFLLIGGIGVLFGLYVPVAVASLVLFLIPVTFIMHAYWKDADPVMRLSDQTNFMKNLALLGAVLTLLAIPRPW